MGGVAVRLLCTQVRQHNGVTAAVARDTDAANVDLQKANSKVKVPPPCSILHVLLNDHTCLLTYTYFSQDKLYGFLLPALHAIFAAKVKRGSLIFS